MSGWRVVHWDSLTLDLIAQVADKRRKACCLFFLFFTLSYFNQPLALTANFLSLPLESCREEVNVQPPERNEVWLINILYKICLHNQTQGVISQLALCHTLSVLSGSLALANTVGSDLILVPDICTWGVIRWSNRGGVLSESLTEHCEGWSRGKTSGIRESRGTKRRELPKKKKQKGPFLLYSEGLMREIYF